MRPCPPIQDALRRGNPPLSLHHTPPRPSGDPRKHAGTLSRRPRTATLHACAKLRPKRLFLLHRARRVLFLGKTKKRMGGASRRTSPPAGAEIPEPARPAARLMLPPLVASSHQIVDGDAEVVRQLPGVFQVGEVNTTLKFLVVLLNNPNRLSYLNLCLFFLLAQFLAVFLSKAFCSS